MPLPMLFLSSLAADAPIMGTEFDLRSSVVVDRAGAWFEERWTVGVVVAASVGSPDRGTAGVQLR